MHKFFNYTSNMLDSMHWSDQWTRVRWFELSVSVMWLLDNYPNGNVSNEKMRGCNRMD